MVLAAMAGLGLAPGVARADDAAPPALPSRLSAALDDLVADSGSVGGMVAASLHGRFAGFYGWGDARRSPKRPVTPDTLFHVGSNGKFVTAVAVLQLVQAGRLTLADPLGRHVPGLPPVLAQTPITHLLHQTSGLPDYLDQVEDWSLPVTRRMVFDAVAEGRDFEPGEAWAYSNTNYFVLGWLIERLSGMSYADYVSARIFRPSRMPNARADSSVEPIPNRAQGFTLDGDRVSKAEEMEDAMSRAADGGVLFSARDIAPWAVVLADDGLLAGVARGQLFSPARLSTGRAAPYGCGVFMETCRQAAYHHHSGSVPGFESQRMAFGGSGIQVWAVTNTDGDTDLPLDKLCLAMAEGLAPNSTYASLPLLPTDARTAILRRAFGRAEADLPRTLMAPELIASGGETAPDWGVRGDHVFAPVEHWQGTGGGTFTRYRWVGDAGETDHVTVGWTPEDKVFWIY